MTATQARFRSMTEGTLEDWMAIGADHFEFTKKLPDRVLGHLRLLDGDFGGFAVDRLTHSLQTATRAYRANRDDEYIVCALLHDIGDTLAPKNHPEIAAAILKPYVSEENHWMVQQHGLFQGKYYFHFMGGDPDSRDQYKDHPYYDRTVEFCHEYDQSSFDRDYPTMRLEEFEPLVRQILGG